VKIEKTKQEKEIKDLKNLGFHFKKEGNTSEYILRFLQNYAERLESEYSPSCEYCGTTEMLCGFNGCGCSQEPNGEEDE